MSGKRMITANKGILLFSFLSALLICISAVTDAHSSSLGYELTQCANDSDNDGIIGACQWINGALTTANSLYAESDGVPQRWLFRHQSTGLSENHTAIFQYTFTKNSVYGYDFLVNVDHTMPASLIHPCSNLPSFATLANCDNAFGAGGQDVQIPSDPFDEVPLREHPLLRYLHFGCVEEGTTNPTCTLVSIETPVHIPDPTPAFNTSDDCFQNCGNSDVKITVHFTTPGGTARHFIGMWFSGQLASAEDPDGDGPARGWGTGFGASSAPGSSYHIKLIELDGDPVGGQDDQINANVIQASHHANLSVVKTCPETAVKGNNVSYTITVTNNGPETATQVFIDDSLPSGVTFISASPSQGTCTNNGNVSVHCDIGFLQPNQPPPNPSPGSTAVITIIVNVPSNFAGSGITDTVTVGGAVIDPDTTDNTDSCTTILQTATAAPVDLSVTKTDDHDGGSPANTIVAGNNLIYTITVKNLNQTTDATNVVLTDTLPPGVTFVSSNPGSPTCTQSSGIVTCNLGTIAKCSDSPACTANAKTVTITVTVASTTRGTITNSVNVLSNETDSNPTNNSATDDTIVIGQALLTIDKSCAGAATSGDQLVYHITVSNAGPSASLDTDVNDTLPSGVTFVSAVPSQGSCTPTGTPVTGVHCDLVSIPVGGSATIAITVVINSTTTGNITNTATVVDEENTNPTTSDPCTTSVSAPPAGVDLQVTKQDSPDPVVAGENLTYTIVVTNGSADTDATGVTLTDTLPGGVTFVSATPSQGSCSHNGNISVTCNLGTLAQDPPNSSNPVTIIIVVTVGPSTRGTLHNSVSVSTTAPESDLTNNTATADTTVIANSGLTISKSDSSDPALDGSQLTYTIDVENIGPSDATNVQVVDTLPPGAVSFVFASSTQGSCSHNGNISVTCNLGTISPGGSVTITIGVTLNLGLSPGQSSTITNIAHVTSVEEPTDAQAEEDTTVFVPLLASIPTLTEWGMIIFMLFAGLGSIYYLRRRKRV